MSTGLYKENILDHYKNPRNYRGLENCSSNACLNNVTCGDEMEVFLNIEEGILKEISFQARGCAISIASMSMLTEKVKGKKVEEIMEITDDEVLEMVGLEKESPRIKCVLLGVETLRKALHQ